MYMYCFISVNFKVISNDFITSNPEIYGMSVNFRVASYEVSYLYHDNYYTLTE